MTMRVSVVLLMMVVGCAHGVDVIDVVPTENGVPLVVDDGPWPDAEQAKAGVRSGAYSVLVYDDKLVCTRGAPRGRSRSLQNIDRWNADDEIGRRLIALDVDSAAIGAFDSDDDLDALWLVVPIEAAGRAAAIERGQRAVKKLQAVTTSPIAIVLEPDVGPYLVRGSAPTSGEGLPVVVVGPPSPHAREWLERFRERAPVKLEGPPVRYERRFDVDSAVSDVEESDGITYSRVVVMSCCFGGCDAAGLVWDGAREDTIEAEGPGVADALAELPRILARGCRLPED